jgi:hypothetical protein
VFDLRRTMGKEHNPGAAHGAIKVYFSLHTACTRVQTVSLDPHSCTGEMSPSVQVYTPDESTSTAVHSASLQTYICAAGAVCAAQLCTATHSRCVAVLTISLKAKKNFNFPSTFYDQIGQTRAAMGRAAMIAHSFIIIL